MADLPRLQGVCAWFLAMLLALPLTSAAAQQADSATQPAASQNAPTVEPLPDSPGAVREQSDAPPAPAAGQNSKPVPPPVGTAAAEALPYTGVAASRPAGVALAPAKQRRVRPLVIKIGLIAAGGVALGATLALTKASPSTPPGGR